MYVGRIVAIGKNNHGKLTAMYRVSSRSFPNRQAKQLENAISILPKKGFENDIYTNPYIAYNCLRLTGSYAIATNGTQTDPITEKLETGMGMRDSMISVMFGMDYEHDSYNTPRVSAIVDKQTGKGCLGIIRHDAFFVEEFDLKNGEAFYVCTYEHNKPGQNYSDVNFSADSASDACDYILNKGVFADLEKPITSACALETDSGFETAFKDI